MDQYGTGNRAQYRFQFARTMATYAGCIDRIIFGKAARESEAVIVADVDYIAAFEFSFDTQRTCRKQAASRF